MGNGIDSLHNSLPQASAPLRSGLAMKPGPFAYARPNSIEEALELLAAHDGAKIIAGGQSLVPMMNLRMAQPPVLVDINRIPDLGAISLVGDRIIFGALARHVEVKTSALVASYCPLVAQAYEHIAHETVRNRGTIGGNLAHADPASELPAVMLVLDAEFLIRSARGERRVTAETFFVTALTADLEPDEMLVAIDVPVQPPARRFAIDEFAMRKGDLAIAGVCVALDEAEGRCREARIALFGVSDRAVRIDAAEQRLIGSSCELADADAVATIVMDAIDYHAAPGISAEYRRSLAGALTARTIRAAWSGGVRHD